MRYIICSVHSFGSETDGPTTPAGVYGDGLDENGRVMDTTSDNVQANDTPADCFTEAFYVRCPSCRGNPNSPFWQGWATLRLKTYRLIENKYFETAVITMILLSSMALVSKQAPRDMYTHPSRSPRRYFPDSYKLTTDPFPLRASSLILQQHILCNPGLVDVV